MLFISPIFLSAAIILSFGGGIVFAQWPRPSRVRMARFFGSACLAASVIFATAFAIIAHAVNGQLEWWVYLSIAFIASVGIWVMIAYATDRLTGGHVFGGMEPSFMVEDDDRAEMPQEQRFDMII